MHSPHGFSAVSVAYFRGTGRCGADSFPPSGFFPSGWKALGFNGGAACSEYPVARLGTGSGHWAFCWPATRGIQSITDFAARRSALDTDSFGTAPQTRSVRPGEDRDLHDLIALVAEQLEGLL